MTLCGPEWTGLFIQYGFNHNLVAIVNTYVFSFGMVGLYAAPIMYIANWEGGLHRATWNWIIFSVFTEIVFQVGMGGISLPCAVCHLCVVACQCV